MLPPESEKFKPLADAAFEQWASGAKVNYRHLKPGKSGAVVLKVDIRGTHKGDLENGQYILKLSEHSKWSDQSSEIEAYERAVSWNPDFARGHIPTLIRSFNGDSGYAMLYDIAGQSLDAYMAMDGPENPGFYEICGSVITDMLNSWVESEPGEDKQPHALLADWLGYRLDPVAAGSFHTLVDKLLGTSLTFNTAGEALINPLKFCKFAEEKQWPEFGYLRALLHNDLHGGNILAHRATPEKEPYWIIDFGLSNSGAAGFDQAYLEIAQILYCLGNNDPAYLIGLLKQLDLPDKNWLVPAGTFWLKNCLQRMREATIGWRQLAHLRRRDDINRQFQLARVAAGINWANKPLPDNQRYIALCYAGWSAREYIRNFESDAWQGLWSRVLGTTADATLPITEVSAADDALWQELWKMVGGFSTKAGKFLLVSEAQGDDPKLRSVGQLPWSAVIDLDPYSDTAGLHRQATPALQTYRGLHTFSTSIPPADFNRGTAWMMAAGWDLKRESATEYENWLWDRLPIIRTFLKTFEDEVNPSPVYVIVLPGASLDPSLPMMRLAKIIGAVHETMRGRAKVILLGRKSLPELVSHQHIPMDVSSFLAHLEQTFGSQAHTSTAQVPSGEGEWRTIPVDSLRTMQENLVVLHSNIIEEVAADETHYRPNTFWRGHPPTWADFQAGNDITRSINTKLYRTVKEELEGHRNHTALLYHTPGSGGDDSSSSCSMGHSLGIPDGGLVTVVARAPGQA